MAITEFLFPALKNDKASIEIITRIAPIFRKKLTHPNPGLLNGFRGFVVTENGKDVREDFREIVIFGESTCRPIPERSDILIVKNGTNWTLSTTLSNQISSKMPLRP